MVIFNDLSDLQCTPFILFQWNPIATVLQWANCHSLPSGLDIDIIHANQDPRTFFGGCGRITNNC